MVEVRRKSLRIRVLDKSEDICYTINVAEERLLGYLTLFWNCVILLHTEP